MNETLLNSTLTQLSQVLERAERLLPQTAQQVDWSAHAYVWQVQRGQGGQSGRGFLQGLHTPRLQALDDLVSIERQKNTVIRNTEQFVRGMPANHVLLTGARGTGKSSLVRGCLAKFGDAGLRVIELARDDVRDLAEIVDLVRTRTERFIIFCDDLTFEANDSGYKALKSALDGSFNGYAENVLIYATSNRRHLMPEYDTDNEGFHQPASGEIHPSETVEEKIALSERFGLWLHFYPFKQEEYLSIVDNAVHALGYAPQSEAESAAMRKAALQFTLQRGSRSARIAQHFARQWVGEIRLVGGFVAESESTGNTHSASNAPASSSAYTESSR